MPGKSCARCGCTMHITMPLINEAPINDPSCRGWSCSNCGYHFTETDMPVAFHEGKYYTAEACSTTDVFSSDFIFEFIATGTLRAPIKGQLRLPFERKYVSYQSKKNPS